MDCVTPGCNRPNGSGRLMALEMLRLGWTVSVPRLVGSKYLGERNDLGSSWFKSKAAIEAYRALVVPWQHGCLCGFNGFRF